MSGRTESAKFVYCTSAFKTELQRNCTAKIDMDETETTLNIFGRAEYRS